MINTYLTFRLAHSLAESGSLVTVKCLAFIKKKNFYPGTTIKKSNRKIYCTCYIIRKSLYIYLFKKISDISLKCNPKPCRTVVFLNISYELLDVVSLGIKTCSTVECHSLSTAVFDRSFLFLRDHCNTSSVIFLRLFIPAVL
jgi:hypothetical protein